MNLRDGDPKKRGGAYPPKGVKRGRKAPSLPARRSKPAGGWPASIVTKRHGPNGTIAADRAKKRKATS